MYDHKPRHHRAGTGQRAEEPASPQTPDLVAVMRRLQQEGRRYFHPFEYELAAIAQRLIDEGRMPPIEKVLQSVMQAAREVAREMKEEHDGSHEQPEDE
jgi:hypothetical protein